MPERKRSFFRIAVPLISVFLILLVFEVYFRIRGTGAPQTAEEFTESEYMRLKTAEETYLPSSPLFARVCGLKSKVAHLRYPRFGTQLREYEYPKKKPAGAFRILGMGDSFAWGWGVYDFRLTLFKLLECWLNADDRTSYEVINGAEPGANIQSYETFLNKTGFELDPDLILLVYNINDANCFFAMVPFEAWASWRLDKNPDFLCQISKLYEFIKLRITKAKLRNFTIQDYHDSYFGKKKVRWLSTQRILLRIARQCRQRRIRLMVVIFPLLLDLEKNYPFSNEVELVVGFLKENGIEHCNLLPDFIGKKSIFLWTLPHDSHPNQVAHRIAAEAIYRKLMDSLPKKMDK